MFDLSFSQFLSQVLSAPGLGLVFLLTLGVVLVNGWTDAPNAIATAVGTGALSFRRAAGLAAVCNLLGGLWAAGSRAAVARTLYGLTRLGEGGRGALCAALAAVILWAVLAWVFGAPTSESHALVAGLSGAALALPGGWANLQGEAWARVGLGLGVSLALGWLGGAGAAGLLEKLGPSPRAARRGQIAGAAAMAFVHGAQDGQKFMALLLLGLTLPGGESAAPFDLHLWLAALCALTMAAGTAAGGRRIVERVGRDMAPLTPLGGLAADAGGAACLLACTLAGLPVSTTHAKTAAILGAGRQGVNRRVAGEIGLTWLCTFPCCALLGFLLVRLFPFSP